MHFLYLLNVVVLLSFSNVVSSSPVAQGTTSKCNARDIAIVKRTANEPTYFCSWWNSDTRTRTPFMELTVSQVTNACKCISKSSKNKRAATVDHPVLSKGQSVESCSVVMSKQFTEPWHFCKFYTAYPRTTSPFRKYSAKSLLVLCDCVEEKSISSTTKKSSTKKDSVTKTTIKSSSTKSSSSKKPTSSSSKRVTSSSKKSSLPSSSSKRSVSSSSHKATSSSAKSTKTSSTMKPISTSKSSTSSVRKTTSSSSTKKSSSSTKVTSLSSSNRHTSTTSRSSISRSLKFTSIKPSSSTKSSSKILSSSQPSVRTTTSSKSSSILPSSSSSSTKTTTTSSSTSSATATKTHTGRMDGQFYLRVANTEGRPNDYYVSAGEVYWLEPSRQTLFSIDSNGYLYRVNGLDADYVVIYDNGYIHNYGAFGQYHAGNLRCSYDENYLLSCAITSVDGTLVPATFSYNEYFDWLGLYAPSGIPTMNLYVEFAVSSTPSTTSSSGSTTLFTNLSTAVNTASPTTYFNTSSSLNISSTVSPIALSTAAYNVSSNASTTTSATASPTVASICTLVPHLPNGGFEDGTNQTAWSGRDESLSSWAPTTTKPFDGTLSGQFTFRSGGNLTQTSSRVILKNTLSDLCPGSQYSITYRSYCDVSTKEECFIRMRTSESEKGEGYFSRTLPGSAPSDWFSNEDDPFEFTAASSTTTLYVYVGTRIDNRDVGNIYVDDFSIALSGSKDIQRIA